MITNQKKEEIVQLAQSLKENIEKDMQSFDGKAAGVYNGANRTDAIWVKDGLKSSFFFVSPCMRSARAETFITMDGEYEFTLHAIDRYGQRNEHKQLVDIVNAPNNRYANIMDNIANFWMNEKILGVVGCSQNRGRVIRTTNGVMLCSDHELHSGIKFVNTWVPYSELKDRQKKAVDMFDKGHPELSKRQYSEYFLCRTDTRIRYRVFTNKGGVGTCRKRKKQPLTPTLSPKGARE